MRRNSVFSVLALVVALMVILYVVQAVGLLNASLSAAEGSSSPIAYSAIGVPVTAVLILLMVVLVAVLLLRVVARTAPP